MFSKTCEYALRALIYIYNQNQECTCNIGIDEVSEAIKSPRHFTAKILQTLSRQHIISSMKGPTGGFFLTEKQAQTNILELVKAIDGPKIYAGCLLGLESCNERHPCPMHEQFKPIREKILILLENNTVASIAKRLDETNTFLAV